MYKRTPVLAGKCMKRKMGSKPRASLHLEEIEALSANTKSLARTSCVGTTSTDELNHPTLAQEIYKKKIKEGLGGVGGAGEGCSLRFC